MDSRNPREVTIYRLELALALTSARSRSSERAVQSIDRRHETPKKPSFLETPYVFFNCSSRKTVFAHYSHTVCDYKQAKKDRDISPLSRATVRYKNVFGAARVAVRCIIIRNKPQSSICQAPRSGGGGGGGGGGLRTPASGSCCETEKGLLLGPGPVLSKNPVLTGRWGGGVSLLHWASECHVGRLQFGPVGDRKSSRGKGRPSGERSCADRICRIRVYDPLSTSSKIRFAKRRINSSTFCMCRSRRITSIVTCQPAPTVMRGERFCCVTISRRCFPERSVYYADAAVSAPVWGKDPAPAQRAPPVTGGQCPGGT
ncbi:hypothetical protein EVAR_95290_1 [Eumeta japonica]|uniref:Uncharacterized protein n=1 Tax=Eumeta variegata TaxID=151549 RepID=A0A4C1U9W0_EUMVA|nr:hypothetical protein EVAR_95290_1 [Eumeta japonica]